MDPVLHSGLHFCRGCFRFAEPQQKFCEECQREIRQFPYREEVLPRKISKRLHDLLTTPCAVSKILLDASFDTLPGCPNPETRKQQTLRFIAFSMDSDEEGLLDMLGGRERVLDLVARKSPDPFFCQLCYRPAESKNRFCSEHHYVDKIANYRKANRRKARFLTILAAHELEAFFSWNDYDFGVTGLNSAAVQDELIAPEPRSYHYYQTYPKNARTLANMRYLAYQSSKVNFEPLLELASIQESVQQETGKKPITLAQLAEARGVSIAMVAKTLKIGGSVNLSKPTLLQWRPDSRFRSVLYDNPLFGKHEQKMERLSRKRLPKRSLKREGLTSAK